jgi:hypothetical protein
VYEVIHPYTQGYTPPFVSMYFLFKEVRTMKKIIRTQEQELLNLDLIVEISIQEAEDELKLTSYAIVGVDIAGKDHIMAVYKTEKEAEDNFSVLTDWLVFSTEPLFKFNV